MSRRPPNVPLTTAVVAAALGLATSALADPPASLQQFSDQAQQLYAHARLGMVRVRLPTPQWLARENRLRQFMAKWGSQLDPAVREQLMEEQEQATLAAHGRTTPAGPSTAPSSFPAGLTPADPPSPSDRVLVATGLLIDAEGHAVFPLYIDRSDMAATPTLPALTGDGRPTVASFVGSDRNTNLTVLKLADVGRGQPAPLADTAGGGRPPDGSLALVVATDASAHLTVWTAASADVGLVVRPDGSFAGFGFGDDFLAAGTARPIVDQLVATGVVRRPVLGVRGIGVRRADVFDPAALPPGDAADDVAGGPSAVYVRRVEAGSVAERADIRPADVILSIAGQAVGPRTFAAVIANRRGDTILRVRRGTQTLDVTVNLRLD